MAKKLLVVDEVATRLGLERQDVLAMIRARRLHGIVVDGVLHVAEQDVHFILGDAALLRERHGRPAARPDAVLPPPGLTDEERAAFFSMRCNLPKIDLANYEIGAEIITLIPKEVAQRHKAIAVQRAGCSLIVAMADPTNLAAIDEISLLAKLAVEPVVATEARIAEAIERYYGKE